MGTAQYQGEVGGLYGGGKNQPPRAHFEAAMKESAKIRPLEKATWAGAVDNLGGDLLAWLLATMKIGGTVGAVGLAADMKLNTTVAPFILRGAALLGADSANCPMSLRQKIWNKLAVDWRPDKVHDQVRTIDFDELPTHFDAYIKGLVRGRTVVKIAADPVGL
jgi:alcohol dehydrogenase